jgi:hypothetical protein
MASVVLNGSVSGSCTITAPSAAGTTTLTLPATSGTVIVNSGAQTIEFADGSASAPSITNSGDTNTGMFFPAADTIASSTSGTERMRIDSDGNVILGSNTSTTAYNKLNLWTPASTLSGIFMEKQSQVVVHMGFKATTNTDFFIGTGSYTLGTYGVYLANTGTSWISVSDERQKDIIEPIENALTKVNTLRTVIGKYKHDEEGVRRSFLIAQDVQAVFPEAVKTQSDEEALLGLSYTDVIPLLVAAIKEQQAIIETLKSDIAELKAKVNV